MKRPVVAVTMGDPAGIGPEVVLGALKSGEVYRRTIPVVIGSVDILRKVGGKWVVPIEGPEDAEGRQGVVEVIDVQTPGIESVVPGEVQAAAGIAADAYIRRACDLALEERIEAISTAPISKESLRAAGIEGIGHTELLADYLHAPDPLTLFITGKMRIFFLSRHLSLRRAIDYITEERSLSMIRRVDQAVCGLGIRSDPSPALPATERESCAVCPLPAAGRAGEGSDRMPRIAVAALNPHASDGGQFGNEEAEIIIPAIEKARGEGIDVVGPIGADSVFHQAIEGRFDCVISLYHDQGHIAAKTRDFFRTVTATLGLPVLRTSVDHGTGFDIAWQGKANPISVEAAILTAAQMLEWPARRS